MAVRLCLGMPMFEALPRITGGRASFGMGSQGDDGNLYVLSFGAKAGICFLVWTGSQLSLG